MRAAGWKGFASGVGLVGMWLATAPCAAQTGPLAEAHAAHEAGELDRAEVLYRVAIERGGMDTPALARAHARLGVLAAASGDLDALARAYRRALALAPSLPTPEELSPDASARVDELRRERDGRALSLRTRAAEVPARGAPLPVEVVLLDAPEAWAERVTLEGETWSRSFPVADATTAVLVREEAWQDTQLDLELSLRDGHGNVLARGRLEMTRAPERPLAVALAEPAPTSPVVAPAGPEWFESPLLWVLVGVLVVGAAVGVGLGVALSPQEIEVGTPTVTVSP